jgi:hypothetical protein
MVELVPVTRRAMIGTVFPSLISISTTTSAVRWLKFGRLTKGSSASVGITCSSLIFYVYDHYRYCPYFASTFRIPEWHSIDMCERYSINNGYTLL